MKIHKVDILALVVASGILLGWFAWDRWAKDNTLVTDFFTVRSIFIPDFIHGEDPAIVYDRSIRRSFTGTWIAETISTTPGENFSVCTGTGTARYAPNKELPPDVTLSWLMGKNCDLPAGQYRIAVNWEIRGDGYPVKYYSVDSNIFRVVPEGAQLYVAPEVVQQLQKMEAPQ